MQKEFEVKLSWCDECVHERENASQFSFFMVSASEENGNAIVQCVCIVTRNVLQTAGRLISCRILPYFQCALDFCFYRFEGLYCTALSFVYHKYW
jgi:hypothetical protein